MSEADYRKQQVFNFLLHGFECNCGLNALVRFKNASNLTRAINP